MLSQILEITLLNIRNLGSRLGSSSVIVVGIAGVVGVLIGLLSMAVGFQSTLTSGVLENRAIIMRDGSDGELSGSVPVADANIVARLPGIAVASVELYTVADIPKKASGQPANLVVRGMGPAGLQVRPEVDVVAGRLFESGKGEIIVGIKAADQFQGLELGSLVDFRDTQWRVVGHFTSDGSVYESEVWVDLPVAQATFRREGSASSMRVLLDDPAQAESINEEITTDPRLDLALQLESEFFAAQSESRTALINTFGYVVSVIMAVGAVFAALNTMYTAVSTRTTEIATLRALGFGSVPVVISVLIEALLLALSGGLLGALIVYFIFDGYTASTLNFESFSQVAFDFAVTPDLIRLGITWAIGLGLIGGLFPAIRAARVPITTALRGE